MRLDSEASRAKTEAAKRQPRSKQGTAQLAGALAASRSYVPDPGAKMTDGIVLAAERIELGAELATVTSDVAFWGQEVDFTDLALLRLRGRRSFGSWLEVFAAGQLLLKQPAGLDESVFQGALGGARAEFLEDWALTVSGSGGPLLDDPGWHGQAAVDLMTKQKVDSSVRFELSAGYAFTTLQFDPRPERPFLLHELVLRADALLGRYDGGFIVGFDYRVPLASSPDSAVEEPVVPQFLNPDVQIDFHLGGVISVGRGRSWDLYATYNFIDRGEANDPSTMLPIIDGGFDQQQVVIGVQHRFGPPVRRRE